MLERYQGALIGLAVGDALGTTLEFTKRERVRPISDLVGGGPFGLAPGEWTDDTSMAMCLAESLVERGFDARDQMERYVRWWHEGYWSSNGRCFDIGTTVRGALQRFLDRGDPMAGTTDPNAAGNGSLMRLAPVALRYAPDPAQAVHLAAESSRTTHGAAEAVDACRYFAALMVGALEGRTKEDLLSPSFAPRGVDWRAEPLSPAIAAVVNGSYKTKSADQVRATDYVVHTLEAALWAFHHSNDFGNGALLAVNLGEDADTTGAVYGQLAGAYYGIDGIPEGWGKRIARAREITVLAAALLAASAQERKKRLGISRDVAARLGRDTVEIADKGTYTAPSGRTVNIRSAVAKACEGTVEYPPDATLPEIPRQRRSTRFAVENATVLDVGRRMRETGPVAALNFAAAGSPGGGFLTGARAQEESIARSSALFHCIRDRRMYEHHRRQQDPMYSDWVIHSPEVPVFRDDAGELLETPWTLSILTCAAVNGRALVGYAPQHMSEVPDVMRRRTHRVLAVAAAQGHRRSILGAWGCGAFGLDPGMMAGIFHEALTGPFRGVFDEVVFAITDWSEDEAFIGPFARVFRNASAPHVPLPVPIPGSYWLIEGQLLAGEYPGASDEQRARTKLEAVLRADIRSFIDLTEPVDLLEPYEPLVKTIARELGTDVSYRRIPIRDMSIPTGEVMSSILEAIRTDLAAGRPVYFHCWGGIGRTGTVAACWLVEQGHACDRALEMLKELRASTPDGHRESPQTPEQTSFVRNWRSSEKGR